MKKLFKVLVLFVTITTMVSLTSCKKDNAQKILGKWQFKNTSVAITTDDPELQSLVNVYINYFNNALNEEFEGTTFEFNADNTVAITMFDPEEQEYFTNTATYSIEGDNLIIDGEPVTIKTLTNKSLVIVMTESYDEDGISGTLVETFEFSRQ